MVTGPVSGFDWTVAYVAYALSVISIVVWGLQIFMFSVAWCSCRTRLHKPKSPSDLPDEPEGVSILKPLMGIDPYLEGNLESHFTLQYPRLELLLCVQDPNDPVLELVAKMRQRFPNVDCKLFLGGKDGVVNPMVHNMAPGYEDAKYDLVWVSTSRIRASTSILVDLVARMRDKRVAICHQLPFMTNDSVGSIAAIVEKIAFGCNMGRNYLALDYLNTHVFTGMSYVVRKSYLDDIGGLAHFGRYLAEDYFLSMELHGRGYDLELSAYPAQQMVAASTLLGYKDRMVRWWRLRVNMLTGVTLLIEPLTECLPLGLFVCWGLYYLFDLNPFALFACHSLMWVLLDYRQLRAIQGSQLSFSFRHFVSAWCVRELLNVVVYFEGLLHPRRVTWGKHTYRVTLGGHTTQVIAGPLLPV